MTQHTGRDAVWDATMRTAIEEETFRIEDIFEHESVSVSKRTVRDTMRTMADLGWLEKEQTNRAEWEQGDLLADEADVTIDSGASDEENFSDAQKITEDITSVSQLEKGEVYFATVDKATGHSNALIRLDESSGDHINLGPINKSAAGEQVKFRYVQGVWGRCLDEEHTYDGYDPKEDGSSSARSGHTFTHDGTITESEPDNKNKLLKGKL